MYKVDLTYFKENGKFYTEGNYFSDCKHLHEIWDEVRYMTEHPGLYGKWKNGPILINVFDHPHEHPRLVWCY